MNYPTKDQLAEIRSRWFPGHIATFIHHADGLDELVWKKPDSGTYGVRYLLYCGTLFVTGDIGLAAYQWGGACERITFEWLAKCDLHYFHEKLEASESGREYVTFDFDAAVKNLREEVANGLPKGLLDGIEWVEEDEHAFIAHLRDTSEDIDGETIGGLIDAGQNLSLRCAGHLVGIQMAIAQRTAAEVVSPALA